MQNSIWKLATVAALAGCCFLAVLIVKNKDLIPGTEASPAETPVEQEAPVANKTPENPFQTASLESDDFAANTGERQFIKQVQFEDASPFESNNSEPSPELEPLPLEEPANLETIEAFPAEELNGFDAPAEEEVPAFDTLDEGTAFDQDSDVFNDPNVFQEDEAATESLAPAPAAFEISPDETVFEEEPAESFNDSNTPVFDLSETEESLEPEINEPAIEVEENAFNEPSSEGLLIPDQDFSAETPTEPEPLELVIPEETALEEPPGLLETVSEEPPLLETTTPASSIEQSTVLPSTPANGNELLDGVGTVTDSNLSIASKPQVTLEKMAPETVILGEPMVYHIVLKNIGESTARNVVLEDIVPKGTTLTGTIPRAEIIPEEKKLIWELGELQPGEERKISVRVTPNTEGEVGSVSTVNFVAEVAAKTNVTAPKLEFDFTGPEKTEIGKSTQFAYFVRNIGSAPAEGILIRNLIPESLRHPGGNDLEYEVGTLQPGEEKEVKLVLMAVQLGDWKNIATLTAKGGVEIEKSIPVQISGNRLSISRKGPRARYIGKQAEFQSTITNDSDTPASQIVITETVPQGLEFVSASNGGQYDPQDRVVAWQIPVLEGKQSQVLQVNYKAIGTGSQESQIKVIEQFGTPNELISMTEVKGYSSIDVEVLPLSGPVEIGEVINLHVQAKNRGPTPSTQVEISLTIPPELQLVELIGSPRYRQENDQVIFEPINSLAGNDLMKFDVRLKAKSAGDIRFKVSAHSNEMSKPVNHEEAFKILEDE